VRAGALDPTGAPTIEPLVQEHSSENMAPSMVAALRQAYLQRAGHRCFTLDHPIHPSAAPAHAG
jgi:hypothetical protein